MISLPTSSLPAVPKYEELNVEETFDDALEAGEMRSFWMVKQGGLCWFLFFRLLGDVSKV